MEKEVVLEIQDLVKTFGGLTAVNRVSTKIHRGEIRALIGPNGSGKTTMLNVITGLYRPEQGKILFEGKEIQGLSPHSIAKAGLRRTFQNIRLFDSMSVFDNVMVGAHAEGKAEVFGALLRGKNTRSEENAMQEKASFYLDFVELNVDRNIKAGSLSYGQRRLLEIARALASEPRLLLLDESAAGLNPQEKIHMANIIRKIRDCGISLLFIEHDMSMVMSVSDQIMVLNFGSKIAEGTPEEIQRDPLVLSAYLGKEYYADIKTG